MFQYGFEVHCVKVSLLDQVGICREAGEEGIYIEVLEFDFFELCDGTEAPELLPVANDFCGIVGTDSLYFYQHGTVRRV